MHHRPAAMHPATHQIACIVCVTDLEAPGVEQTQGAPRAHVHTLGYASDTTHDILLQFRQTVGQLADGLDSLVCCIIQVICRDDGVLTSLQDLLALLNICAFKSHNQRDLQTNLQPPSHRHICLCTDKQLKTMTPIRHF